MPASSITRVPARGPLTDQPPPVAPSCQPSPGWWPVEVAEVKPGRGSTPASPPPSCHALRARRGGEMEGWVLPRDFRFGVATAGYQIEGGYNGPGEPKNNWYRWESTGRVEPSGAAIG